MGKKSKQASDSSKYVVDLGKVRKRRISDFRAKCQLEKKQVIPNVEEAVNTLCDIALEIEGIQ